MSNGNTVVTLGENSPEFIAWRLLSFVLDEETRLAGGTLTRERYLDLYSECLLSVKDPFGRLRDRGKLPPLSAE